MKLNNQIFIFPIVYLHLTNYIINIFYLMYYLYILLYNKYHHYTFYLNSISVLNLNLNDNAMFIYNNK